MNNKDILKITAIERENLYEALLDELRCNPNALFQCIPYYQPKVSLDKKLCGVEALARWPHPRFGLLQPAQFLSVVEDAGLLDELTWSMLEHSLKFSAQCHKKNGQYLPVAINIPPIMLENKRFVSNVIALLFHYKLPADILTLEVIETSAFHVYTWQVESLLRLRMLGCHLSIDDFGIGWSNTQRLLELPFSELKIPYEFVRGIAENSQKLAFVSETFALAKKRALNVVVEGVETIEDYNAVKFLGSPLIQGFFIAPAMDENNLRKWISAHD
ncbi:EAL domain-containing protein [Yersinia intermedia]|uniref:EAL domain-containing protein n=1 Tax=Yersinia intermedia TaxID=631 RepID=UPI0005E48E01|nr:EAL domain-containing protein [Yersinia intermedia]CND48000.1 sensory box-containing diguanylate cyclase [Yersinia intermedia]